MPIAMLKSPYVLEFLDLPDPAALHEQQLESAVISHLQAFLLELGKGFAFVARQKRMRYEDTDLYVDLVFYNCILKRYTDNLSKELPCIPCAKKARDFWAFSKAGRDLA